MKMAFGDHTINIVAPHEILKRDITIPVQRHVAAINRELDAPWTTLECASGRSIVAPWSQGEDAEIISAVHELYRRAGWIVTPRTHVSGPSEGEVLRLIFTRPPHHG